MPVEMGNEGPAERTHILVHALARRGGKHVPYATTRRALEVPLPLSFLTHEGLIQFREELRMLTAFAAEVCGVGADELAPVHMMTWLMKKQGRGEGDGRG